MNKRDTSSGMPSRTGNHAISEEGLPIGLEMDVTYPDFGVRLTLLSTNQLMFEIKEGPYARTETVGIQVVPLGNALFAVSWQEQDGQFLRMTGTIKITRNADHIGDDRPQRNRALVMEAMTSFFQRHDASAVDRLYTRDSIQHNPNSAQGPEALRSLVTGLSRDVWYEPGLMVAEGDRVAIHGRNRGWADEPQVVIEHFRINDGKLAEHRDVLQNEEPVTTAHGGIPMFDPEEGARFTQPDTEQVE